MSYHKGFSARLPYDPCEYNKRLSESTAPYSYAMYDGKYENCNKCVWDVDSELSNRTRPASKCPSRQYNPKCTKSKNCISTFDPSVPVVLAPEVCPIVFNNLVWKNETGIRDPKPSACNGFAVKRLVK
jgi:hypothetical protein